MMTNFDDNNTRNRREAVEWEEKAPARTVETEELQQVVLKQQQAMRQLSFTMNSHRRQLDEMEQALSRFCDTKAYKISLLMRRIRIQLLHGTSAERKDFLKWVWQHIAKRLPIRKPRSYARALSCFDPLSETRWNMTAMADSLDQSLVMQCGCDMKTVGTKNGRKIFIFAGIPYYDIGGGQRYAQIAKTLNNMGYRVYYIYAFETTEAKRFSMYLPCIKHVHLKLYSLEEFAMDLEAGDAVIFEIPFSEFGPYLDHAKARGNPTVYEHVDNWDSHLGELFFSKEGFRDFLHTVAYVTVTARVLGEKIEEAGRYDYMYCPNAVDTQLFEPAKKYIQPADLVTGKKTLLYYGSLWGEWFDWELISYVANNCNCEINLIGDYQPVMEKLREMPANVHFLGMKQQPELPAYLQYSDIALLPFKNSIIGKYVSPLKIFEYIAMNKPVLATALSDIAGYPNVVASDDPEVWRRTVDSDIPIRDVSVFAAENSWFARCNQILDMIGRPEVRHPSISAIILNHNNKNVIFRCVDSLLSFSGDYDMEIIVVDNDSTDGSCEQLMQTYGDKIKVLRNGRNGCSSGRNLGARHAAGEMLYFLDSDQWIVGAHYLDAALGILADNSRFGAVGWAAGWFEEGKVSGPIADYLPNRGMKGSWALFRTDIAYLGSGGLLMNKSLFWEIGGFDEAYDPTCYEDTDLSLKIRHAGYELAYCPYMAVMHLAHQTTDSGSKRHQAQMEKNGALFLRKWSEKNPDLLTYHL